MDWKKLMGEPLQKPAGALSGDDIYSSDDDDDDCDNENENDDETIGECDDGTNPKKVIKKKKKTREGKSYIPAVSLYYGEGRVKKRVLVLCTGGTLTMAPDPNQGGALAPVEGAISRYMNEMDELKSPEMPDYVLHEYSPFRDSSDLGPSDWVTLANDIKVRTGGNEIGGSVVRHGHAIKPGDGMMKRLQQYRL